MIEIFNSKEAPILQGGYPDIKFWFPPSSKNAFILCNGVWTLWVGAIKDVCCNG